MSVTTIILDAGHGGNDLGDAYYNRYEKNDNLRLTLEVGGFLEQYGYNVRYIRLIDNYISQIDRVNVANMNEGDFLLTIHRMIGEMIISESGLGFYVDTLGGVAEEVANSIGEELRHLTYNNYIITIRNELPILRETNMPSLMMGIGHLNSEYDNMNFDNNLVQIADAIARGIFNVIPVNKIEQAKYEKEKSIKKYDNSINFNIKFSVQVGLFTVYSNAVCQNNGLLRKGYPSQLVYKEPYYAVRVGVFDSIDGAASIEYCLRLDGYNTLIVDAVS